MAHLRNGGIVARHDAREHRLHALHVAQVVVCHGAEGVVAHKQDIEAAPA